MPVPHFLETLLDRPIAYHRCFFDLTHSIKAALLLSQAVFWSKRTKNENGWFYKSRNEWRAETGMTREEQEGARRILRQLEFWQEKLQGVPGRLFYRIDFNILYQKLVALNEAQGGKPANKLAENPPTRKRGTTQQAGEEPTSKLAKNSPTFIPKTTTETTHNNGRRVRVSSQPPTEARSAFTIKQWLAYAKTQPNINNKMAFANAMARSRDNDGVMELHLELQRQAQEPAPPLGCEKCRNSPGWEHVPGKGTRPCDCRAQAKAYGQ